MKKRLIATILIVLIPVWAWGATYYVDTNAAAGGDGTTSATTGEHCAWDTIADVNAASFSAGDSVLFNKGCIWWEVLNVPSSGSNGSPITFGAYGTGDDPIISGAVIIVSWFFVGSNIWGTECTFHPVDVYFDDVAGTEVGEAPDSDKEWYWLDNVLYIYSIGDPSTTYTSPGIEIPYQTACIAIIDKDYVTIDGISVTKANVYGIGLATSPVEVIIKNCTVYNNGYSGIVVLAGTTNNCLIEANTIHDNGGDGIELAETIATSGNENIIQNNTIYDNVQDGVHINANYTIVQYNKIYGNAVSAVGSSGIRPIDSIAGDGSWGDYNIIRYNVVYDQLGIQSDGHGILLDHYSDHCQVHNNVVYGNSGTGISGYKVQYADIYNNTVYNNGQYAGGALVPTEIGLIDDEETDRTSYINIKNNAVYAVIAGQKAVTLYGYVSDNTAISFTNNCWYKASGDWYDTTGSSPGSDIATWNALSYVGTDSKSDPFFTNAAGDDFTLTSSSPCINAGTDPFSNGDGDQTDMAGNKIWDDTTNIPVGKWADGVDIGAYGYFSGTAFGVTMSGASFQ